MRILITAGPTAEDIDPVRYLTNRSTGRMGMEVARAALRAGHGAKLILGPTALPPPAELPAESVLRVRSADEMLLAVLENLSWCDALVMTAAVADYAPAEPLTTKLKKKDGDLFLRLKRTPDILAAVKERPERAGKFVVGFSLDVELNPDEGLRKLRSKNLDCIVVNTTSSFGADAERGCIVSEGGTEELGEIAKAALAEKLISRIAAHFRLPSSDEKTPQKKKTF